MGKRTVRKVVCLMEETKGLPAAEKLREFCDGFDLVDPREGLQCLPCNRRSRWILDGSREKVIVRYCG